MQVWGGGWLGLSIPCSWCGESFALSKCRAAKGGEGWASESGILCRGDSICGSAWFNLLTLASGIIGDFAS